MLLLTSKVWFFNVEETVLQFSNYNSYNIQFSIEPSLLSNCFATWKFIREFYSLSLRKSGTAISWAANCLMVSIKLERVALQGGHVHLKSRSKVRKVLYQVPLKKKIRKNKIKYKVELRPTLNYSIFIFSIVSKELWATKQQGTEKNFSDKVRVRCGNVSLSRWGGRGHPAERVVTRNLPAPNQWFCDAYF